MDEAKYYGPTAAALDNLAKEIHAGNVEKGFYGEPRTVAHLMGLVMTELAETIEADRQGQAKLPCEKVPAITCEEEEVADAIIRLLDFAAYRKIRIGPAVISKLDYNRSRPFRHGKVY